MKRRVVGTWWRRRSLRARLTAAATLAIVVVLSAAGYGLIAVIHHSLLHNVDNTALERARAIGAAVNTAGASAIADVERRTDAVVQVVDESGNVVVSSAN